MHADGDWQAVEGVLSKDMATVGEHLQTWKLKLRTTKTVSAVVHLNNKEAKRELKVNDNNETLLFCSKPKYLGVTLDRSLTCRRHLEPLRKKLTSRVGRRTLEAASWLWLRCWSNNVANSHPSPGPLKNSTALQSGAAVLTPTSLTPPSTTPCKLRRNKLRLVLYQWTIFSSLQASNLLSFVAKGPHCL